MPIANCKHPKFTAWALVPKAKLWRRDCLYCSYFETYPA